MGSRSLGLVHHFHHAAPIVEALGAPGHAPVAAQAQGIEHDIAQPGFFQHQGHAVDVLHRFQRDNGLTGNVTERGDFLADARRDGLVAAADYGVGLDTDGAEFLDAVLGGLGLEFLGCGEVGEEGQVDVVDVVAADVVAHLTDGLQEREALDVSDGAADFDDNHLRPRLFGEPEYAFLDVIGHVGHGLYRPAEEVAAALLGDEVHVDVAGCEIGTAGEFQVDEPLVVAQVQVGLAAVMGDKYFAVLVRRHCAGVDVQVWIEFQYRNAEATALQDAADGSDTDALAQ